MTCIVCNSASSWPLPQRHDAQIEEWRAQVGETAPYFWRLCRNCGNGYPSLAPRADILDRYWQANRTNTNAEPCSAAIWQQRAHMSKIGAQRSYAAFAPLFKDSPGRMLDIACGLGETVRIFCDHGWQAEGTDIDHNTKPFHDQNGLSTTIGRFENLEFNGPFQLIQIAHAIYFITEPMAFLQRVKSMLAPGGQFAVVISDVLDSSTDGLPSYPHTFYPTGQGMRYALALAGFRPSAAKKQKGSIYIAATPDGSASDVRLARPNTHVIHASFVTQNFRHALIGKPNLAMRRHIKRLISK